MKIINFAPEKERGVVLLTCLVFLLILLGMLRFTLSSARLEEEKASIDLDIVSAREAAQSALDFAERYILEQGRAYCLREGGTAADCAADSAGYAGRLFGLPDATLREPDNELRAIMDAGLYTGTFMRNSAANCRPFWACVNWPVDAHSVRNSAIQQGLAINANFNTIECSSCTAPPHSNNRPQFIIERLTSQELAADAPGFLVAMPDAVILRVTAVGFGKGAAQGAAANTNMTNVMLQSTYILGG